MKTKAHRGPDEQTEDEPAVAAGLQTKSGSVLTFSANSAKLKFYSLMQRGNAKTLPCEAPSRGTFTTENCKRSGSIATRHFLKLTIIWISHLHTCRSCSLFTYILFRAQRTPWLIRTRNTIANPPGRFRQTNNEKNVANVKEVNDSTKNQYCECVEETSCTALEHLDH